MYSAPVLNWYLLRRRRVSPVPVRVSGSVRAPELRVEEAEISVLHSQSVVAEVADGDAQNATTARERSRRIVFIRSFLSKMRITGDP
jgi:hypothetical protein